MSKSNKIIIQCCICGAGTKKAQAPTVPYTPEEIAREDACKIEHDLSEETFAALRSHVDSLK